MLHRHPSFEIYRVEQGELSAYVETEGAVRRTVLGRGEVALIPGGSEHTIRNESPEEARAFVLLSPGVEIERFARAVAQLDRATEVRPPDVLALAEAHGIEITRPLAGAEE